LFYNKRQKYSFKIFYFGVGLHLRKKQKNLLFDHFAIRPLVDLGELFFALHRLLLGTFLNAATHYFGSNVRVFNVASGSII
jgi:hypothetical protein